MKDIIERGCQDESEFEVLKMCLAGTEFISATSKNQFDVIKILAAKAAWTYIGKISDVNQVLSVIAIEKIDGKSDMEIYDEVKSMENFVNIHKLLGIRAIKQDLQCKDKFIKRVINKYVSRLADEYHIPKPKLRERSTK